MSEIAAGSERETHLAGGAVAEGTAGVTHHTYVYFKMSLVFFSLIIRLTCSPSGGCVVIVVGGHSLGFSNTVV